MLDQSFHETPEPSIDLHQVLYILLVDLGDGGEVLLPHHLTLGRVQTPGREGMHSIMGQVHIAGIGEKSN